ncbi:chemotaxis protein [Bacillus thuringiensis]|uniref:chemotaxis protein n=1 Tax=Bacillus thuringiensis TaxID=1428 RepID=UPI0021D653B5|nr:chemotaxis protein [Bacillus thuringiensis]MCU7667921.1 chemotaxis protein [Bacillus thuringiensis]
MKETKGILLESGTNELEIITFTIGVNLFSINVMKVKEIIHSSEVTSFPESHPAVEGVLQVRGEIIPVINLAKALGISSHVSKENSKFIITELNHTKVVFRVDDVHRIQRISWQQIEEPSSLAMGLETTTAGIVKLDDKIILMLDYEKIVYEISPNNKMVIKDKSLLNKRKNERKGKTIYVAEDSAMLRQVIKDTLESAGYENLTFFKNGEEALIRIEELASNNRKITDSVHLLITDIEMPKMDGHHLTKRIKESENTKDLPIIIFSSLISNELYHKGTSVGADAQITKPEITELINTIDNLLF